MSQTNPFDGLRAMLNEIQEHIFSPERQTQTLKLQLISAETMAKQREKRVVILEQTIKKMTKDTHEESRKEIKKYSEVFQIRQQVLTDKDNEISTLRSQLVALKSRYTEQSTIAHSARENTDAVVGQRLDQTKSLVKDLESSMQEMEMERILLENKFKQIGDKVDALVQKVGCLQAQNSTLQQIINRGWNHKININHIEQKKNIIDQQCLHTDSTSTVLNNSSYNLDKISQLISLLTESSTAVSKLQALHLTNIKLQDQCTALVLRNIELQTQCSKYQLKKPQQFPILTFFKQKQNQINDFQASLLKIQTYIEQKDEEIARIFALQPINCECGKMKQILKLVDNKNQELSKMKELIACYKQQVIFLQNEQKKKTKKQKKNRCAECVLGCDERTTKCEMCHKLFHSQCFGGHKCDDYKDGLCEVVSNCSMFQ